MERWVGKTALVTGASVGIGYAVLEALAREGVNVIGCARNIETIEALKNRLTREATGSIHAIKCDLTKEEQILAMFKEIEEKYKVVHILVNNAGMAKPDDVLTGNTAGWRNMLDLNVLGVSICSREAVRLMEKHGVDDGHIININSMAGHRIPNMAGIHFYSATKHMLTAMSKAMHMELGAKKSGIRVTNLSPGGVATEFANSMVGKEVAEKMLAQMKDAYVPLQSEDVKNAVMYVLSTPPHVAILELTISPTKQPHF